MKYLVFILFTLSAVSCKKSTEENPKTPSNTDTDLQTVEKLQGKKWHLIKMSTVNSQSGSTVDEDIANWPAHFSDDYYLWKNDLTYISSDGAILRPGNDKSVIDTGKWDISNSTLTMTSNNKSTQINPWKITSISNELLEAEVRQDTYTTAYLSYKIMQ